MRVFACTTSLTVNLTKTRFEFLGMKADVKNTMRSIRDVSAPVVEEVEDESETERRERPHGRQDKILLLQST
jgi:hypothetical protein